ncbi:MAG: arginine--tRNA ligase [Candidatus Andersenbacteria bacterium]
MAQIDLKQAIAQILDEALKQYKAPLASEGPAPVAIPVEHPLEAHADYASPVAFMLAKQLKKKPADIAAELVPVIRAVVKKMSVDACGYKGTAVALFEKIEATGPFINFSLSQPFLTHLVAHINQRGDKFGTRPLTDATGKAKNQTIVVEYSGVNIGKPFSIGHLRSTVNGAAIASLLEAVGYTTVRLNYLGDWGTQFGKLIAGFKKWGDETALKKSPITELMRVYVRFHDELAKDDSLAQEARAWFRKLEQGDREALGLWQRFVDVSLAHAKKIYALLETPFDRIDEGEAQYRGDLKTVMELLAKKGLLKKSQGATIVDLESQKLPPLLVQKTDEASLYATRELAAAIARQKKYQFSAMLYEVGLEQELHFRQVFTVLHLLGFTWANSLEHIGHGLYRMQGKKMSTRAGRVADMLEILEEAIERAQKVIASKNPALKNKDVIARQVGIGAVKYNDLSQNRLHTIDFDFDRMLSLEGNSAPYLQYTHARIKSIVRKAQSAQPPGPATAKDAVTNDPVEQLLARRLVRYPEVVAEAAQRRMPHLLATELFELASRFNLFYQKVPVLKATEEQRTARLALCQATAQVLQNGLALLGIHAPHEM